jgi:hypothetical protein
VPWAQIGITPCQWVTVIDGPEAMVSIDSEYFVAGNASESKFPRGILGVLAAQQTANEPKVVIHLRTILPRHLHTSPITDIRNPYFGFEVARVSGRSVF